MSSNKKTVLKGFDYMHCDDFATYLENMAAKGWHFKEWGVGLKFEKGEPENVTYAVEIFTKASEHDMRPEPNTQEFAEYCEAAGWKLIDAKQKFCIFKKVKEDAVALFTPKEHVENAFKGAVSGNAVILLVLYGVNALLQWINILSFFENNIFASSFLFSFAVWNVMFLGQLVMFVYAFLKKHKLMKEINEGKDIYIGSYKDNKFHIQIRDIYTALLVLLLLIYLGMVGKTELIWMNLFVIVATLAFCAILAKVRPSNNTSVIVQVMFIIVLFIVILIASFAVIADNREVTEKKEDVPLYMSDYREVSGIIDDINVHEESNLLGSSAAYFIFGRGDSLHYDIYQSKYTWILDRIWEEELEKRIDINQTDCTKDWGANIAFRNNVGNYYVRYENQIFILSEDSEIVLSKEQIAIIREKMNLR